jgi:predicted outer membrane protein
MMSQHEKEMENLAEKLEMERDRQLRALGDSLSRRRNRKLEDLQRRNDTEYMRTMIDQKKEVEELHLKVGNYIYKS